MLGPISAAPAPDGVRFHSLLAGNRYGRRPALIADLPASAYRSRPPGEMLEDARILAREAGDPFIDAAVQSIEGRSRLVIHHDRPRSAATALRAAISGEDVPGAISNLRRDAPTAVERALVERARARGIPAVFRAFPGDRVRLGEGARLRRTGGAIDDRAGALGTMVDDHPPAALALLADAGLPVDAAGEPQRRLLVVGGLCVARLPEGAGDDGAALAIRAAALFALPIARIDLAASGAIVGIRVVDALDPFVAAPDRGGSALDAVIDQLVGPSGGVRIPLVVFAGGDAGAAATALADAWAARGLTVGRALPTGLTVGRLRLHRDDRRGRRGLPLLLDHPLVDAAVAVLDPADLLMSGLGHDRIDRMVCDLLPRDPVRRLLTTLADSPQ
ncbi:MAG: hypothetical protein AB7O45_14640 [Alphaproteobacteria bacterium]